MKIYAEIQEGKVVNTVVWDGEATFEADGDLVEIPEGVTAGIDWDYIDGEFVDNRPVAEFPVGLEG